MEASSIATQLFMDLNFQEQAVAAAEIGAGLPAASPMHLLPPWDSPAAAVVLTPVLVAVAPSYATESELAPAFAPYLGMTKGGA